MSKKEKCDRCEEEYHEDELKSVANQRLCEHCHYDLIGKSEI